MHRADPFVFPILAAWALLSAGRLRIETNFFLLTLISNRYNLAVIPVCQALKSRWSVIERPVVTGAPKAQGPYSAVVRVGDLLFVSGQGPIDPATNEFLLGSIQEQTRLVIENIRNILVSCGSGLANVVKCSVFLSDANDFAAMNVVYAEFFGATKPARTTVAAILVQAGMKVEIDCIAWSGQK